MHGEAIPDTGRKRPGQPADVGRVGGCGSLSAPSCHGKTVTASVQRRHGTLMRHYEIMIILDPNLEERTVQPSLEGFLKVVTDDGGKVGKLDIWGKRRLAYPIDKKPEGIRAIAALSAAQASCSEPHRQLNLNEGVLRTKVLRPEHR